MLAPVWVVAWVGLLLQVTSPTLLMSPARTDGSGGMGQGPGGGFGTRGGRGAHGVGGSSGRGGQGDFGGP
jgi:hypothetical protein